MDSYEDRNGNQVLINNLSDKDLVLIYKFFQRYCSELKETHEKLLSNEWVSQCLSNSLAIKEGLKSRIIARNIRISEYQSK